MDFPEGIEGDYIQTKNDNLFFDVKGLLHPPDTKICFLRFYPDPNGTRIRKNVKYKKIYDIDERYSYLRKNYPKYLFSSDQLDLELQGVHNWDIRRIFSPRDYLTRLQLRAPIDELERSALQLCGQLITKGRVPEDSIGITGSLMVGLYDENSDFDIIIYGTEESLNLNHNLDEIFKNSSEFRKYNLEEYKSHFKWRAGGSEISFEDFMKSERRKNHQGIYKGKEFFIRYIKSPEDWGGDYYDFKYKNLGRIHCTAQVLDCTDSIFTPCSYKISVINIIESPMDHSEITASEILEINSFRGRYCEQALTREIVRVKGKLEKVIYKNKKEFYRILLTDQKLDTMIVLKNG